MQDINNSDKSRHLDYNYRLWDADNERYIDPAETLILADVRGDLYIQPSGVTEPIKVDKNKYIYEWNTKFTDILRRPVFVGDIVRFTFPDKTNKTGLVGWDQADRRISFTPDGAPTTEAAHLVAIEPFTVLQKHALGRRCEIVGSARALEVQARLDKEQAEKIQALQAEALSDIQELTKQNE